MSTTSSVDKKVNTASNEPFKAFDLVKVNLKHLPQKQTIFYIISIF